MAKLMTKIQSVPDKKLKYDFLSKFLHCFQDFEYFLITMKTAIIHA